MADKVVIVGVRRGGSVVPASELRQMMGRAGRAHDEEGIVEVIVDSNDEGAVSELLTEGSTTVESSLSNPDVLAMALMPEIHRGSAKTMEAIYEWCSRSFCPEPAVDGAMELLKEVEAIEEKGDIIEASPIGSCAARFYFHPADVFAWWCNFSKLFEFGLEDDEVAPAWALGNVPFDRIIGDLGERRHLASDCASKLPFGLEAMEGSLINVVCWWHLMGGPSPGAIRPACLERRKGFGRWIAALNELNKAAGWDMGDFFSSLSLRVRKGLRPSLLPLGKFDGMSKGRVEYLYSLGVESPEDLAEMLPKLDEEIDDDFRQTIERVARECGS